jgi:hypothetical protein
LHSWQDELPLPLHKLPCSQDTLSAWQAWLRKGNARA